MDERTLAYVNLYAVLGSLVQLCELDADAAALIAGKKVSVGFKVKGGPSATLDFNNGRCSFREGTDNCVVLIPFSDCAKFNGMINGTVTPVPARGFTQIGFLLHSFMPLTDILSGYLRAAPEKLADPVFFEKSTVLMFHLITSAVAAIGNADPVGKASASYIADGCIRLSVIGGPVSYIEAKDHHLTAFHSAPEKVMSYMEFNDIKTARDLFDGKINAVVSVGLGKVRVGGLISQVDNINRIMSRIPMYLA